MSVVTNLILSFASLEQEDERIKEVNDFVYNGERLNLVSIDYNKDIGKRTVWYGGNKFFEGRVYMGAFNHFNTADFIEHLKTIRWEAPDLVQVIIKEDWDERFRIVEIT
jgi:hypothetical protein